MKATISLRAPKIYPDAPSRGEVPELLFEAEREALIPLRPEPYETDDVVSSKVSLIQDQLRCQHLFRALDFGGKNPYRAGRGEACTHLLRPQIGGSASPG